MTNWFRPGFLSAVALLFANCSDEEPKLGLQSANDAAVVMDTFDAASVADSLGAGDAPNSRLNPSSSAVDARADAPPSAECLSPCIMALFASTSTCPLQGACTQKKQPPDAGADLLQCYEDGAVVSLTGAPGGRLITVVISTGQQCFALDEASKWSIMGSNGEVLGRLELEGADVLVACGTVRVRDGDCSLPVLGDLLRPCAEGVCSLPKPAPLPF